MFGVLGKGNSPHEDKHIKSIPSRKVFAFTSKCRLLSKATNASWTQLTLDKKMLQRDHEITDVVDHILTSDVSSEVKYKTKYGTNASDTFLVISCLFNFCCFHLLICARLFMI